MEHSAAFKRYRAMNRALCAEFSRCESGKQQPTIPLFKVYFTVTGTEHDGYCSDPDEHDVTERAEFAIVTDDAVPADREPTVDDFAYLNDDVDCDSGSGYCGCTLKHTVTRVERWTDGWSMYNAGHVPFTRSCSGECPQWHYLMTDEKQ